jgi:hypothetical protein
MFSKNKVSEIKIVEVEFKLVEDKRNWGLKKVLEFFKGVPFLNVLFLGAQSKDRVE